MTDYQRDIYNLLRDGQVQGKGLCPMAIAKIMKRRGWEGVKPEWVQQIIGRRYWAGGVVRRAARKCEHCTRHYSRRINHYWINGDAPGPEPEVATVGEPAEPEPAPITGNLRAELRTRWPAAIRRHVEGEPVAGDYVMVPHHGDPHHGDPHHGDWWIAITVRDRTWVGIIGEVK